jgi:carnitine O-acetyltransferase
MDQFRALFGACRVPDEDKDTVEVNTDSTHVLVLGNNQMYFFQALWPDGTLAVNEEDILEILLAIRADASTVEPEVSSHTAMGVLTTLPRREWAKARNLIVSHSDHNRTALDVVDGALFVLVLDNFEPKDIHEAAANMLHGTYNLRTENNLIDYQVRQIGKMGIFMLCNSSHYVLSRGKGWFMLQSMVRQTSDHCVQGWKGRHQL